MNELPHTRTVVRWHVSSIPYLGRSDEQEVFEVDHRGHSVEEKAHKVRDRGMRDAIAGPWTVMIHLGDASFADLAVMGTRRFDCIALATVASSSLLFRLVMLDFPVS